MLGQFVQVQSFDMTEDFAITEKRITTKQAGGFSSGWLDTVYASQGLVATLSNGGAYNSDTGEWDESTFVLGFDTAGPAPRPFAYSEVPGKPLNQYSVDLYDGHLRLVTQEWRRRPWSANSGGSSTLNKIVVLKIPGPGEGTEMRLVGETGHVGKDNERVYSVRFIQDKAYIVTFEQIGEKGAIESSFIDIEPGNGGIQLYMFHISNCHVRDDQTHSTSSTCQIIRCLPSWASSR